MKPSQIDSLAALLRRDLAALRRTLEAYPDQADIWRAVPGLPNSGGTLALHVAGNLSHFVGRVLGGSDYVRDRPAEFARRDLSRRELLLQLDSAGSAVDQALARVSEPQLAADFPEALGSWQHQTADLLNHLAVHLAYHLGQADYHRRAVTGDAAGIGAMSLGELASARPAGPG